MIKKILTKNDMKNLNYIITVFLCLLFISCTDRITSADEVDNSPPPPPPPPIYAEIKFDSPKLGERWYPGEEHIIKWNVKDNIKKVNLILLKKKQYHRHVIAYNINNSGSFKWVVPGSIPYSVHYQIKIEEYDIQDNFSYSEVFEILFLEE